MRWPQGSKSKVYRLRKKRLIVQSTGRSGGRTESLFKEPNVLVNVNLWIRCDEADSSVGADDLFPDKWPKSIGFDAGFTWSHVGVR
jgi:hypothetical protein